MRGSAAGAISGPFAGCFTPFVAERLNDDSVFGDLVIALCVCVVPAAGVLPLVAHPVFEVAFVGARWLLGMDTREVMRMGARLGPLRS